MELGSEFDLDVTRLADTDHTIFTYLEGFHAIYTDSGRSALRLLSDRLFGETVLVPDYICGSVPMALPEGCSVIYYPVDRFFCIDMEGLETLVREHAPCFLYLMHYFGSLQQRECLERIGELKKFGLTVIEDTTHSLFTAPRTVGDVCLASLRKWFPVPDGGVLYAADRGLLPKPPKEKKAASRKVEAMVLKKLYLKDNLDCNAKYREIFTGEEEAFDRQKGVYGMSDMARFLLSHFEVGSMCRQRQRNAGQLLEELARMGYEAAIKALPSDVLLALPVYAKERDRLRAYLMERRIYCAVHWPPTHPAVYGDTGWMGEHILSLPMDQRYGQEEMEYLLENLREYFKVCKKRREPS